MSRFVLRPVRILQTYLSVLKDREAETYTFKELIDKLIPSRDPTEGLKLGLLKPGSFVGLVTGARSQRPVIFVLHNTDNSGNIERILKADPSFETRFLSAYRVEEAVFDSKVTEAKSAEDQI